MSTRARVDGLQGWKRWGGTGVAVGAWVVYGLLVSTFVVFMSGVLLYFALVAVPVVGAAVARKTRSKRLVARRLKATGWALGLCVLLCFPAFWLLPEQVHRRVTRETSLLTPDAPAVQQAVTEFLAETPDFASQPLADQLAAVKAWVMREVVWELDFVLYSVAAHVGTPTEALTLGSDDCQGQAVVMASMLLALGFPHVWAVESPFHWWVLVRDPALGPLPAGWERSIEAHRAAGAFVEVNRRGRYNTKPLEKVEEIVLLFSPNETLYPRGPLEAFWISVTAGYKFRDTLDDAFLGSAWPLLFVAMLVLGMVAAALTRYQRAPPPPPAGTRRRLARRRLAGRALVLGGILCGIALAFWGLAQVIVKEAVIVTLLACGVVFAVASEEATWARLGLGAEIVETGTGAGVDREA